MTIWRRSSIPLTSGYAQGQVSASAALAVDETTSGLSVDAGRRALKAAGVRARDIDLVIVGTVTPDMLFPSTACSVQRALGVRSGAAAFDISAACSGFLFALDIADTYITSGRASNALVIGVDIFSRIIDWKDRSTCVLFGDGAGAAVLHLYDEEDRRAIISYPLGRTPLGEALYPRSVIFKPI